MSKCGANIRVRLGGSVSPAQLKLAMLIHSAFHAADDAGVDALEIVVTLMSEAAAITKLAGEDIGTFLMVAEKVWAASFTPSEPEGH